MRHLLFCLFLAACSISGWSQNALAAAEELAASEEYSASSALLETYIEENPERRYDLGRAWWLLSYNHLQTGELEAARAANAQSVQIRRQSRSGDLAENYLRTAQLELAAGQPRLALEAAEQGLQMLVEDTELYVRLYLTAAKSHAEIGQYQWVDIYLETIASILAIELRPSSSAAIEAYYTAAELELLQSNEAAARHWYVKAVRYDRDLPRLRRMFEKIYALPLNSEDN